MPPDSFTGIWRFNSRRSSLSTPPPQRWTQEVDATATDIRIRERISRPDGSQTVVSVDAKFDGNDHPVTGSPIVDAISYVRSDPNRITATGKKSGAVTLTETISVDPGTRILTLTYVIYRDAQPVATGTAVFQGSD